MAQEYKRVLVAIDGSKGADAALRTAIEVTKRNDHTHLDVLRVLDLNSLEYGGAGIPYLVIMGNMEVSLRA